jgi:tetratricopeptide (TPR) repeat protein
LFLAAVWSAHALVERAKPRWLRAAIACAAVAALSALSWRQIRVWRDHETVFEHAIAVTGENPRAHAILAAGLRSAGRLDEALAHAREASLLEPGSARSWTTLGMVEADLGQWSAARDALETAVRLDARLPLAWRFLGQAAAELGRSDEAERALRRATDLAPGDAGAWNELGLLLASRRRGVEALEAYRRALAADPTAVAAWLNLATLCDALGRTAEAARAFEEAVRADPASPGAWRARGRFLRDHGSPSGAAESFHEADRLEAASRRAPRNGVVPRGRRRVRRRTAGRSPPRAAGAELGLYSRPSRGERESR